MVIRNRNLPESILGDHVVKDLGFLEDSYISPSSRKCFFLARWSSAYEYLH